MERRLIVSVVGNAACSLPDCTDLEQSKWGLAFELGKALVDNGFRVLSGGGRGVMRAVFAGAHASDNYKEGDTIAILPSYDTYTANDFADIVIPTGADLARNITVANSEVVVAVGGGSGTLSEISMAWKMGRMIISYKNADGWGAELAGKKLDDSPRYDFDDRIWAVDNAQQVIQLIREKLPHYNKAFDRIPFGVPVLREKSKSNWVGPVKIRDACDIRKLD